MVVDSLVAPLLRVELFQGLKPAQLSEIARRAERIVFRAGENIAESGTEADGAVLIVGGDAEWQADASGNTTEDIEVGSLIGEMAMLVEHVHGATIVAKTPVRCLKLNRAAMHELMLEDAHLARHLTRLISSRLSRIADEMRSIDRSIGGEVDTEVMPEQLQASRVH